MPSYKLRASNGVIPNAPPISAPLVGMFTLTMPQSDPFGLQTTVNAHTYAYVTPCICCKSKILIRKKY